MGSIYTATLKESANGKKEYNIVEGKSVYFLKIYHLSARQPALMPEGPLSGKDHGHLWIGLIAGLY